MPGPRPKPTWLKAVCGNPSKRPLNVSEPQPAGDLEESDCPEWLTEAQRLLWRRVILDSPRGLLRKLDAPVVATYVCAADTLALANAGLAKYGHLVKGDDGGAVKNPWNTILRAANQTLLRCAAELGFSPSSRSRVTLAADKRSHNPFAELRRLADMPTKGPADN